ncbi:YcxB family protein [Rhodopirellula europaea]|jgi:hypothetical protein|nr:YcxB family protein [Rhodopirellula europaea]
MNSPVTTTFTFTRDEYILAMKRHYRSALNVGRDVVAGLLAVAGGIFLVMRSSGGWTAWALLVAGVVLLSMVAYALFVLPSIIYRSQPKLKDEYSLRFAEDGIGFKTRSIDSTLQWSIYQSWLFDNDFYIMYHGKRDLSVIPRRTLSADDDLRLRQMLTAKIGPPRN